MMLLRINEALFLLITFIVVGGYAPFAFKTDEERERDGLEFHFTTAAAGGALGIPLCLLFLRVTRREDTTAPPNLSDLK